MTIHEFHVESSLITRSGGHSRAQGQRRERLAIVSTRNKLCGIAAYTTALERQLADVFDTTVFDLDQYLLRGRHARVRALGDRHIRQICHAIAGFDAVNLQLEYGTLGRVAKDIERRFHWLIDAAPRLSVTFHTLYRPPVFPFADFGRKVVTLKWREAADIKSFFSRHTRLSTGIAKHLRRAQSQKPVSIIVHNRRDGSDARHLYGFGRVFDHPLSFLSVDEARSILISATRRSFTQLDRLPPEATLIGVFGFLNDYKGFGTAVRALRHLPDHYHLLIFGGVHPNEIPAHAPIHPYLASLLDDAHVDAVLYDQMRGTVGLGLNLDIEQHFANLFGKHPRDLSGRLHFMGSLVDNDFYAGMAICDAVVLPYLEVGQSSSGPISQAVELGCRVIASRTHTFLEFARYHPETIEFFDIGNHLELAERINARRQYARRDQLDYTVETNRAVYRAANCPSADTSNGLSDRFAAIPRNIEAAQ